MSTSDVINIFEKVTPFTSRSVFNPLCEFRLQLRRSGKGQFRVREIASSAKQPQERFSLERGIALEMNISYPYRFAATKKKVPIHHSGAQLDE
jgi:hypothetical protein